MILPPRRNNTGSAAQDQRLITVDRVGWLEDILANLRIEHPEGANIHWSACAENLDRRHKWGTVNEGEGTKDLLALAKLYYEAEA